MQVIVVVVVGAPQNRLITLVAEALRGLFEFPGGGGLCDEHVGSAWSWRHLENNAWGLPGRDNCSALRTHAGILEHDSVDDRGDVARKVGEADPGDAVAGPSIVNDSLPLKEAGARCFDGAAGLRIGTEPAGPFLAGIFGVARARKKFKARFTGSFCGLTGSRHGRRAPPVQASPLGKETSVKGVRFVSAFGFVFGADGENFSGIRGA